MSVARVFVTLASVKSKPFRTVPMLVALGVIVLVGAVRWVQPPAIEEIELKTYDWRMRIAANANFPAATNLGFVFIRDATIDRVNDGSLGYRYGLKWPRHIYGRVVRELSAQGAKAIGFDVLFAETRTDHWAQQVNTNSFPDITAFLSRLRPKENATSVGDVLVVESDEFLAWQLDRSGRVILAAQKNLLPHDLFKTNALAIADISTDIDSDGILRRARAFNVYRQWHPVFRQAAAEIGADLAAAVVSTNQIILRTTDGEEIKVPLDENGNFDLADFVGEEIPAGWQRFNKPFMEERVWHMGIVLAAQQLNLDLSKAEVDLGKGKIILRGNELERSIPVDADGYFYVNWGLTPSHSAFMSQPFELLLEQDNARLEGQIPVPVWTNRLVIIGSVATGNELTDRGATPLQNDTALVSKHWNVANAIITNQFIRRTSLAADLALIFVIGILTALLTWNFRALPALVTVVAAAAIYIVACAWLFAQHRIWAPIFLPVAGAMFVMQGLLVTWRVVFEQAERRRIKGIFSKVVSPNVVTELLEAKKLSVEGTQIKLTIMFADIRGFTELTDSSREKAERFIKANNLRSKEADAVVEEQARATLATVNLYLALVADMVKKHNGTLDKYIGDCVMAFWGAPTPDSHHAVLAVKAAIDAQRAIYKLNLERAAENSRLEGENAGRAKLNLPDLPLLPVLQLGTGINTGIVTAGLMGSEAHIFNYTVFGREVNVASRLEGVSGRARIVISEATYQEIHRIDATLAATCVPLEAVNIKGIRDAVKIYEVPWHEGSEAMSQTETAAQPLLGKIN